MSQKKAVNRKELIIRHDFENLGKSFLKDAVEMIKIQQFNKAYEFIKLGLDFVTCDCSKFGSWFDFEYNFETLFEDIDAKFKEDIEYNFIKAFVYIYLPEAQNRKPEGLKSIIIYLKKNKNHYGYYLKGRLLSKEEKYKEALKSYEKALKSLSEINSYSGINLSTDLKLSKIYYRIGRLKEEYLNDFGLYDFENAFRLNYSSVCSIRSFKEFFRKRKIFRESFETLAYYYEDLKDNPESKNLIEIFIRSEYQCFSMSSAYEEAFKFYRINDLENSKEIIISSGLNEISVCEKQTDLINFLEFCFNGTSESSGLSQFIFEKEHYFNVTVNGEPRFEEEYEKPYSVFDNPYYDDALDMDQQNSDFWDSL